PRPSTEPRPPTWSWPARRKSAGCLASCGGTSSSSGRACASRRPWRSSRPPRAAGPRNTAGWSCNATARLCRRTPPRSWPWATSLRRHDGPELAPPAVLDGRPRNRHDDSRGAHRDEGSLMARTARIQRETGETRIDLSLDLDGTGRAQLQTGVGYFDHMLTLLARHSLIDLTVEAHGDLHVDPHHTVEDVGICLGKGLAQALGDKAGIRRYGSATLPMDEVLVTAAVDLSGRAFCVWQADLPPEILGTFNAPLAEEIWRAASA